MTYKFFDNFFQTALGSITVMLFQKRKDIRVQNPIVQGLTIFLISNAPSNLRAGFCKKIQDSGMQLQASLDQLVDLSRVEAGGTELFLQEFSLLEILRDFLRG